MMSDRGYRLRFLPIFKSDLIEASDYIRLVLDSPEAAKSLVDRVESAIMERLKAPDAFEQYKSSKDRKHPYYRIYVGNYTVFYVLIDDVMEVRRLLYNHRNWKNIL